MQVRNNYEIIWNRIGGEQGVGAYNGDIGIVESINTRDRSMVVRMDDKRLVYPAENLGELEIAYAITVHKRSGQRVPGGDLAGGAGAAAAVLPQPVLHRRYPCTEAVHRGGPQGRCEPHDGQHPPGTCATAALPIFCRQSCRRNRRKQNREGLASAPFAQARCAKPCLKCRLQLESTAKPDGKCEGFSRWWSGERRRDGVNGDNAALRQNRYTFLRQLCYTVDWYDFRPASTGRCFDRGTRER